MVPTKVVVKCNHEPDPDSLQYDKRYGRIGICKKCGAKIYVTKFVVPKKSRFAKE